MKRMRYHSSRKPWSVGAALAILLIAALVFGACGAPAGSSQPAAEEAAEQPAAEAMPAEGGAAGGTMIFGRYADSLFLDPVLNDANLDIWVLNSLYDTLLQSTEDGQGIVARWQLATEYSVSDDGLTFTVTLRDRHQVCRWFRSSRRTMSKWSLDRARNPENGIWSFSLESVESVETSGDNQVVLNLSRPDPSLPAALAMFNSAIMPSSSSRHLPARPMRKRPRPLPNSPIGSGPFVLTEWVRGSHMVMERNPYYWETDDNGVQLPYLDSRALRDHSRRRHPYPETAGRRDRRRRVHSLEPCGRISGRCQHQYGALPVDQGQLTS